MSLIGGLLQGVAQAQKFKLDKEERDREFEEKKMLYDYQKKLLGVEAQKHEVEIQKAQNTQQAVNAWQSLFSPSSQNGTKNSLIDNILGAGQGPISNQTYVDLGSPQQLQPALPGLAGMNAMDFLTQASMAENAGVKGALSTYENWQKTKNAWQSEKTVDPQTGMTFERDVNRFTGESTAPRAVGVPTPTQMSVFNPQSQTMENFYANPYAMAAGNQGGPVMLPGQPSPLVESTMRDANGGVTAVRHRPWETPQLGGVGAPLPAGAWQKEAPPERSVDSSARGALLDLGIKGVERLKKILFPQYDNKTGQYGPEAKWVQAGISSNFPIPGIQGGSDQGRLFNSIYEDLINGYVRPITGAVIGADEKPDFEKAMKPLYLDSPRIKQDKLERLQRFMVFTRSAMQPGKYQDPNLPGAERNKMVLRDFSAWDAGNQPTTNPSLSDEEYQRMLKVFGGTQ